MGKPKLKRKADVILKLDEGHLNEIELRLKDYVKVRKDPKLIGCTLGIAGAVLKEMADDYLLMKKFLKSEGYLVMRQKPKLSKKPKLRRKS